MSEVAYAEPEIAQHPHIEPHPAPRQEAAELPRATDADSDRQKQIALQNLNKLSFLISPDGRGAIAAEPMKTDEQVRIVSQSLKTLLGAHSEGVTYTTTQENGFLGLPVGNVPRIHTPEAVQTLAEAGVKDFADALDISLTSHRSRVR